MKRISIYGSTGSIGVSTLNVIDKNKKEFKVMTLVAGSNVDVLIKQIKKYKPYYVYIKSESNYELLKSKFKKLKIYYGENGLSEISVLNESDIYVSALVGIVGLIPTVNMIKTGKIVALANKEVIVSGGPIIMNLVKKHRATLLPIDSEHSAIEQCLNGEDKSKINKILLTASGGPFLNKEITKNTTKAEALNHPTWNMGSKITIDSSTLVNKAFEIIEAKYLFDIDPNKIEVVIHKQSLIHSMVEFIDGTIMANIGPKSMEVPISYALMQSERVKTNAKELDVFKISKLNFEKPDFKKFKALKLAYYVLKKGHSHQIVFNAANEVLVNAFLNDKIKYIDIIKILEKVLKKHKNVKINNIEDILTLDLKVKNEIQRYVEI